MKIRSINPIKTRQFASVAVCLLVGVVVMASFSGCKPSTSNATEVSAAAIHGEPIKPLKTAATSATMNNLKLAAPSETKSASAAPGYSDIGFDTLAAYNFVVDDMPATNLTSSAQDKANEQIPPTVKSFNDKKVSIKGFMLPLKVADGTVTEFLIMKDQSMCCYGSVPKINEWVNVKTTGRGVKPIMDEPVSIEGTLHVGALRENGYLIGIYQMDGDTLVKGR